MQIEEARIFNIASRLLHANKANYALTIAHVVNVEGSCDISVGIFFFWQCESRVHDVPATFVNYTTLSSANGI